MSKKTLLFIICVLLIFVHDVFAQVMIEQGKVVIKANPGETIADTLTIHNLSSTDTIVLKSYWEDFSYISPFDGSKEFIPAGTSERSLSKWITFSPQQFSLEPLGIKKINYSIQVPLNAKGGYNGVFFVESSGQKAVERVGVTIVTRMGSLFFIETSDSTHLAKVERHRFADKSFQGDFVNIGDTILIPDATYYLLGQDGMVAERGEIKKFYLPPGKMTKFKFTPGDPLPPGNYTAVLTFDFGDGENLTDEFDFTKSPDGNCTIKMKNDPASGS